MRTLPQMGLIIWDQLQDLYDHTQQANNLAKMDNHDHTPNRGVRLTTQSIEEEAITSALLADGVATGSKLGPDVAKYAEGPIGSRPEHGVKGRIYYATDLESYTIDVGSGWRALFSLGTGTKYQSKTYTKAEIEAGVVYSTTAAVFLSTGLGALESGNWEVGGISIGTSSANIIVPPGQALKGKVAGSRTSIFLIL